MLSKDPENKKHSGWQNKATALVHMWKVGDEAELDRAFDKLQDHHSLQHGLKELHEKYRKKGPEAYKKYI